MQTDHTNAYDALTADIDLIIYGSGPELERMEACFICALRHWEKFKKKIRGQGFSTRTEEIEFFKFIKPRFTGLVEYYTQRYQALLFAPTDYRGLAHYFWKLEERRIERFFARHAEFIDYYERGETELDEVYFLREFGDGSNLQEARVYDLGEKTSSSHDWIVSRMIALEKYRVDVAAAIYRLDHPMQMVR